MKAIQLRDGFGIDQLQMSEHAQPSPSPGKGEVLVKLEAVSLNYVDLLVIKGLLNPSLPLPYIPVCDGAVEQVGEGSTVFQVGDRVATVFMPDWLRGKPTSKMVAFDTRPGLGVTSGQLVEYKVFREHELIPSPDHLSTAEAATLPIAALTAWNALSYGNLQAGNTVLLHGTGGVSIFALQLAKAQGAKVIITSSNEDKLARAHRLGADLTIHSKNISNWDAIALDFTNGEGVDLVVEAVGGGNLQKSLHVLRMGGHISVMGLLDGFTTQIETIALLTKQATIKGMEVGSREDFAAMNGAIAAHKIHPAIDKQFSFEQTQLALEYVEQGLHFGKVVITL